MSTRLTYVTLDDDLIHGLDPSAITITNADADYPASCLQTEEMSDTARGTPPTKIQIDLGSGKAAAFWAILNHNITAGDVVVRSYSDAFTTPTGESVTMTFRDGDMKGYNAAVSAARYWEIDPTGCSLSDSFFEVGKVIASTSVHTFANNYSTFQRGLIYTNLRNETVGGTAYVHILSGRRYELVLEWAASSVSNALDEVLAMLELTHGGAKPLVLIPDNDTAEVYYVRAPDAASWQESSARKFLSNLSLSFTELSRGKIQVQGT